MSETTRWWWIRHAPVDSGGRIYGNDDLAADCREAELFSGIAGLLPREAVWVTTQLQRTQQTAAALAAHLDHAPPAPLIETGFAEQNFGQWQGLTHAELSSNRAPAWHRFWLAPAEEAPPGGESFLEVIARVSQAMETLNARHAGRDIVAVAHGGSIRAALAVALGLEPERALAFAIDNCSLTRIDHIEGGLGSHAVDAAAWRVSLVNFPPRGRL